MKPYSLLVVLSVALASLSGCERKQTTSEKIENKVNDALDRRPAEKLRDTAEDVKDDVKKATNP